MSHLALNWLRQKPEVTSIINGASSVVQVKDNLSSVEWNIDEATMNEIDGIIDPFIDL